MIDQFDRLRRRNAFVEQYKKEKIFENGLEEFDDARYVLCLDRRGVVYISEYSMKVALALLFSAMLLISPPSHTLTFYATMRNPRRFLLHAAHIC